MARRKRGGRVPTKAQGKTSVVPMKNVPNPPRMSTR
jgi:hypothetical protein